MRRVARGAGGALQVAALVLWPGPSLVHAFIVQRMSPVEVARASSWAGRAVVESARVESTPEGATVERLVLLEVETWRGAPRRSFEVRQWVARGGQGAPGAPRLLVGREYLLFLPAEGERPALPVTVGGGQGAYAIERSRSGEVVGLRTLDGRSVVGVDATSVRTAGSPPPAARGSMSAGAGVTLNPNPRHAGQAPAEMPPDALLAAWRALVAAP